MALSLTHKLNQFFNKLVIQIFISEQLKKYNHLQDKIIGNKINEIIKSRLIKIKLQSTSIICQCIHNLRKIQSMES